MNTNQWPSLVVSVVVCFAAAAIGSVATAGSVSTWYPTLVKPPWTPPSWLFGPVWTLLYLAMAVAAWLVWRQVGWSGALGVFGVQLALNVAWSVFFFGQRSPQAGFITIVFLWLAIALTMALFWRVNSVAGWLFVPYLLWVSFASALNFAIWRLNG